MIEEKTPRRPKGPTTRPAKFSQRIGGAPVDKRRTLINEAGTDNDGVRREAGYYRHILEPEDARIIEECRSRLERETGLSFHPEKRD